MLKYFSESFLCISLWHITSTSCRHMPATKTTTTKKHYVWWAHCWLALVGIVRELRVDVSFAKMRLPRRYSSVRITVTLARLNAVALWSIAIAVLCSQQKHSSILVECVWYAYEISLDQIRTANVALAVEVVLITSHTYTMRIYGDYPLLLTSHSEWRWQYVDLAVYTCMAYMSVVHVPIAGTDKRVPPTTHHHATRNIKAINTWALYVRSAPLRHTLLFSRAYHPCVVYQCAVYTVIFAIRTTAKIKHEVNSIFVPLPRHACFLLDWLCRASAPFDLAPLLYCAIRTICIEWKPC